MKIKKIYCIVLIIVLMLCLLISVGGQSMAADPQNSVITLQQELVTDRFGNENIILKAKLVREDGYPLGERTISFYETLDIFGKSQILLGRTTTTAVGLATINYETELLGEHVITAKFSGDTEALPAQLTTTFNITKLPSSNLSSPTPLIGKISRWGMIVAYGAMAAVLITLLTLLLISVRGVSRNRTVE